MKAERFSQLFFDSNTRLVQQIERELRERRGEGALRALHSIKGAAQIMGAPRLIEAVSFTEQAFKKGDNLTLRRGLEAISAALAPFDGQDDPKRSESSRRYFPISARKRNNAVG